MRVLKECRRHWAYPRSGEKVRANNFLSAHFSNYHADILVPDRYGRTALLQVTRNSTLELILLLVRDAVNIKRMSLLGYDEDHPY